MVLESPGVKLCEIHSKGTPEVYQKKISSLLPADHDELSQETILDSKISCRDAIIGHMCTPTSLEYK